MSSRTPQSPAWKAVYTVVERPNNRTQWVRIGTAFENRDGSLRVLLDALPVNGTLHIRDSEPKVEERTTDVPHSPVPHVSALSPQAAAV
jgi:hypothetical protein